MIRRNYGELGSFAQFVDLFDAEMKGKLYEIRHGSSSEENRPAAGDYTAHELWKECCRLMSDGDDSAMAWVADILGTLGVEWI